MRTENLRAAVLTIDLDALAENWRTLDRLTPGAETAAVVKADAYGCGIARAVPALRAAGCRTFFTAHPHEGVAVRAAAPDARVLVLNGLLPGLEGLFLDNDLVPVLNSLDDIALRSRQARNAGRRLPAAIHLDTGMTRLGLVDADVDRLAAAPDLLDGLDVVLWLTHPACADTPEHPLNAAQLALFRDWLGRLPPAPASFCNSAAIHLGAAGHLDLIRAGVALYGTNPSPATTLRMREVVHLQARILQVHRVDTPRSVGYGATHPVTGPRRIATVGVGYGDGYLRALGGKAWGVVGGHRVPLVGRVSMDLSTFDITDVPDRLAHPGALVSMIGGGVDIDALARAGDTIAYELLTGLGSRYARVHAGGAGVA
ncbi:MAG: alanine racemase [Pseudomonadota bacterium]|nr:alanine racemase [Pseudomonadota bacterium]